MEQAGTLREVYDRQYYVKPSVTKRKKRDLAKYKQSNKSKRGK
jgi:ribosomal protein S21